MESVILGLKILSYFSILMLIMGLYKPWMVLWWEDTQYRLKVIKVYGLAAGISWLLSKLIEWFLLE